MALPFVYVSARGSYREIGRTIGEAAREQVQASMSFFRDNFEAMTSARMTFAHAVAEAQRYLAHAEAHLPHLVDELRGVAEGSNVPFDELLVPNCAEEFTASEAPGGEHRLLAPGSPRRGDRCTAVAVSVNGRHIVGHNMDWYVVDAVNNVLFDMTVPDGTRILGIAGAPYLLMLGLNSYGVASVSNSVHSTDNLVGVPNVFVRRSTLEAPTLEEARARGLLESRARGTNHFFADTRGRLWDVETSATAHAMTDHTDTGFMAHTNHYAVPEMAAYEGYPWEESRVRLATVERILAAGVERGDDPIELVTAALCCHEPDSDNAICGHADETQPLPDQGMTVGSMICDLDERTVYACAGPPCENEYQVFTMDRD